VCAWLRGDVVLACRGARATRTRAGVMSVLPGRKPAIVNPTLIQNIKVGVCVRVCFGCVLGVLLILMMLM
jgi:hypothetical protein